MKIQRSEAPEREGRPRRRRTRLWFAAGLLVLAGVSHFNMKSDVALGRAVGATSVLVRTGYGGRDEALADADHVVAGLGAAAELIADLVAA